MVVPAVTVTGEWAGAVENAQLEEESKVWKLATANSTCWTLMCTQLSDWGEEGPDIIFQQEHHKLQDQEARMQSDARMKGYKVFSPPAIKTGKAGTSGGTAIMIKKRYGALMVNGLPELKVNASVQEVGRLATAAGSPMDPGGRLQQEARVE
eukprot:6264562-Amphidinium_carterae.4